MDTIRAIFWIVFYFLFSIPIMDLSYQLAAYLIFALRLLPTPRGADEVFETLIAFCANVILVIYRNYVYCAFVTMVISELRIDLNFNGTLVVIFVCLLFLTMLRPHKTACSAASIVHLITVIAFPFIYYFNLLSVLSMPAEYLYKLINYVSHIPLINKILYTITGMSSAFILIWFVFIVLFLLFKIVGLVLKLLQKGDSKNDIRY